MNSSSRDDFFASVFNHAGVGLSVVDLPLGVVRQANAKFSDIIGYALPEIIGRPLSTFIFSSDTTLFEAEIRDIVQDGMGNRALDLRYDHRNGQVIWCRLTISFLRSEPGRNAALVVATEDISAQKTYAAALTESRQRYKSIADSARDYIFTKDAGRRYNFINPAMEKLFGIASEEVIGKTADELFDAQTAAIIREVDRPVLRGCTVNEFRAMSILGKNYIFHTIQVPLYDLDGAVVGISGIVRDITREKESETQLKSILNEKDILIKEIHHRVKNNLQIICSLLSLQEKYIDDKDIRRLFEDSRNRVRSMALVHEKLYQSANLSQINFADFINALVGEIQSVYTSGKKIVLRCESKARVVSIDKAVPMALILNELIVNAYNHAFTGKADGEIFVGFGFQPEAGYVLEIADNGAGFPEHFDHRAVSSFGYQLIAALTRQLKGVMRLSSDNGARISIHIPDRRGQP